MFLPNLIAYLIYSCQFKTIEGAPDNCIIECMQNCKDNTCCGQTNEGLITTNNEGVNSETV